MNKPYPVMHCYLCHRPMKRAAALVDGYPVGPVCAAKSGPPRKRGRSSAQSEIDLSPAGPERDPFTVDLFAGA